MNFLEFATKNVFRNMKAYFAYFLSSTISAALLFSFTMIILHPKFKMLQLPEYLNNALFITTVIAYLFLCFFVFYSVSVFLKSRYKEFGILYITGSSKKQIQKMIRVENMIISSAAGASGIIIGIIFSKILLAVSGKLLGVNALSFYFSFKAALITFLAFVVIGMITSVFCSYIIKEDMVLKLLKGTKKPKDEPKSSKILAVLCIILLTAAYYLAVSSNINTIAERVIPVTVMTIIATYLLFSELSISLIKYLKTKRNFYMNKVKLLWISNLLYRIKDNTRMFFLITITTTVALTSIGGVYAYWKDKESDVNKNFPEAFFFIDSAKNKIRVEDKGSFIETQLKNKNALYKKVAGEIKYVSLKGENSEVAIINEDLYKKLSESLNLNIEPFNKDETILSSRIVRKKRSSMSLEGAFLRVSSVSNEGVLPAICEDVYIVKDSVYENVKGRTCYFEGINLKDYRNTLDICNNFYSKYKSDSGNKYFNNFLKASILDKTKRAYGVILFSVIFIGLIFFVTTGSFLYNKCYMDIIEDKRKYNKLYKIGLTFKEIKSILNIEIGVLFLLPYIVAIIHFFFAMNSLRFTFGIAVNIAAVKVILVMLIAQVIYFLVIRKNYLKEIKEGLI